MASKLARLALAGCTFTMFVAAGCAGEPEPLPEPKGEEILEEDANTGTPDFYAPGEATRVLASGADPGEAALAWLEANKDKLAIPDPRASFAPISSTADEDDSSISVKLQQRVNGIALWGVESIVQFDGDGSVISFDGPYVPNLDAIAKAAPKIDEAAALRAAEDWIRKNVSGATTITPAVQELVIHVDDEYAKPALARHVRCDVSGAMEVPAEVFVDAQTGTIIDGWTDTMSVPQAAVGLKGIEHTVEVNTAGDGSGQWELVRPAANKRGEILPLVWDSAGPTDPATARGARVRASTVAGPWDAHAVSAEAHLMTTDDFYARRLKHFGPNGKGGAVNAFVHLVTNPPSNTAYAAGVGPGYPQKPNLFFTDAGFGYESPAVALDIVAHEYTHLVNGFAHGLGAVREPGSVNEAIADIFGAFVEYDTTGNQDKALTMSEDVGGIAHDFLHPTRNPDRRDHYSQRRTIPAGEVPGATNDNGHSHNNSTIISNAWALMTIGGTNDTSGIPVARTLGWDKSLTLWWKTQRQAVTKRSTIKRLARAQTVSIARASKGKFDVRSVACAWHAVGAIGEQLLKKKLRVRCDAITDSCAGKTDGAYCSSSNGGSGYICRRGALTKVDCERGYTCEGASQDKMVMACKR
jgi:Zn-dependent metalloprotease